MPNVILFHMARSTIPAIEQSSVTAADYWLIAFSGIVAFSTVVYAILTWCLVSETRKVRIAQSEPKVSVTFHPNEEIHGFIDLRIRNIGAGPALDITFEVEPEFEYYQDKGLSELPLFKNGLEYLGPGDEWRFFLTTLTENFEAKARTPFVVKVSYRGTIAGHKAEGFVVDFSVFDGIMYPQSRTSV